MSREELDRLLDEILKEIEERHERIKLPTIPPVSPCFYCNVEAIRYCYNCPKAMCK